MPMVSAWTTRAAATAGCKFTSHNTADPLTALSLDGPMPVSPSSDAPWLQQEVDSRGRSRSPGQARVGGRDALDEDVGAGKAVFGPSAARDDAVAAPTLDQLVAMRFAPGAAFILAARGEAHRSGYRTLDHRGSNVGLADSFFIGRHQVPVRRMGRTRAEQGHHGHNRNLPLRAQGFLHLEFSHPLPPSRLKNGWGESRDCA